MHDEEWDDEEIELPGLSRPSLARNRLTHEYLEAGRDLVEQALRAGAQDGKPHPFLRWMSRSAVIAAVDARGHNQGNPGTFRDRWMRHADYIGDLVRWIRRRRSENRFRVSNDALLAALEDAQVQPSALIRELTRSNLASLFENPLFRFQLLASAVADPAGRSDARTGTTAADDEFYREVEASWVPVVTAFMSAHGLSLRPGVQLTDLMAILIAVGEGLAMRELAQPTSGDDRARREALQGLTALALLLGCTGRDGRTVDEALDDRLSFG